MYTIGTEWLTANSHISGISDGLIVLENGVAKSQDGKGPLRIRNCFPELDAPGEYYVDEDTKLLYFYPPKNVDKNSEILSILIGTELNSDFIFINKMKDLMKEHCVNVWNKLYPNVNKNNYDYLYSAAFYGYIGLAQTWINSDKKDSPDYMAKITSQVILKLFDSIK